MLNAEVQSLNTALDLKSTENKELRRQNLHLQLLADELPEKETEINKLKHQIEELRAAIEQRKDTEK